MMEGQQRAGVVSAPSGRAARDFGAELVSRARWFGRFLLPKWLSAAYESRLGRAVYILALVAVVAVVFVLPGYVPGAPLVGLLLILALCGLAVRFWAWKRYTFFQAVEEAGIRVVRGPGGRQDFLTRLAKLGVSGLDLGPAGRVLPDYVPRAEEVQLRERLRLLLQKRKYPGVLVTGVVSAGKTRTSLELIADARPGMVLVWTTGVDAGRVIGLGPWAGTAVLLLDDLRLGPGSGKSALDDVLPLMERWTRVVVVGTVRRSELSRKPSRRKTARRGASRPPAPVQAQANGAVRELKTTALSEIAREDPRLRELARSVADAEPVDEGGPISAERIMERYNGHPGGLVAGPEAMGRVYEGLNDDQRTILRAAKVLKWLGVRELNSERLAEAAKLIARKRRRLEPVLDELRKIGFVARHAAAGGNDKSSTSLHAMPSEEERSAGELEQHSAEVRPFDYATLKGTLRQRLEAVQLGAQEDESPSSGNGAAAHQDRLDTALLGGATVEEDASPTEGDAALSPGEEAEAIRPAQADAALPQDRPAEVKLEFYQVYLDQVVDLPEEASALEPQLLEAWRKRGDAEAFVDRGDRATDPDSGTFKADPKTSLEKGIGCYMEALGFYRPETEPPDAADGVEYVDTLTKLGSAYASLARHQEPVENLQKSIQAFQLALSFPTAGATADQFAATHKRLGDAYASMARQQEPVENLGQAIQAFHEAIEYQKLEEGPLRMPVRLEHAATHNNLGSAHASLARHQEPVANLGLAIRAFQEAVKLHAQERAPKMSAGEFPPESAAGLQYGATQNNLGNAYASLAHYQAPVENLRNATHAYFEALRFLTPATAPGQHAAIQKKLAVVFAELIEGPGPMQLTPTIPTNPPGHTPRP